MVIIIIIIIIIIISTTLIHKYLEMRSWLVNLPCSAITQIPENIVLNSLLIKREARAKIVESFRWS